MRGSLALLSLAFLAAACGPAVDHTPGSRTPPPTSSFTTVYGIAPGAGLQFSGNEWGYAVTADGFGGFSLAMLGDPRYPTLQDRFFGSVYVEDTTTLSDFAGDAGQVVVSPQRIDFDLLLRGADQASFTVKNNSGAGGRLFFDAFVAGSHACA